MVRNNLNLLRKKMRENDISYFITADADPHMSEYVGGHYKVRTYLSGFTGSNGTLLVGLKDAYLWTDGRYFVQAADELNGSTIGLMKMGQRDVPTIISYLDKNLKKGDKIFFNGNLISISMGQALEEVAAKHNGQVIYDSELFDDILNKLWAERPEDSAKEIYTLPSKVHGENTIKKLQRVRKHLEEKDADYIFISKLDDQMWLFNIRGGDIECNPVAYSYTLIGKNKAYICLKDASLSDKLIKYFEKNAVSIISYNKLSSLIKKAKGKLLLDKDGTSYGVYKRLEENCQIIFEHNITEDYKAVKNSLEIENIKGCYLRDSLVLTRFIKYIKENATKKHITETEAADMLDNMRRGIEDFIDLSFPTISAFGPNAAMMHYEAVKGSDAKLSTGGLYLVDSGGQYLSGTTDVTRTIVLGKIHAKTKMHYTKVTVGMLRLMNAKFLYGCSGRNLDILARGPLWDIGIDYKCGTGHGIGYILNVHEGPQNIRPFRRAGEYEAKLEEGMVISDEPGVYIAGQYGIRIENAILCKKLEQNSDGQFMGFDTLTLVPIDLDGIDTKYMNDDDLAMLNAYHKLVFNSLKPYMKGEELRWLKNATRNIRKFSKFNKEI